MTDPRPAIITEDHPAFEDLVSVLRDYAHLWLEDGDEPKEADENAES